MSPDPLPQDVRRFVSSVVRSVNELELLLLLARDAAVSWTPGDAARELYQSEGWVAGHLEALVAFELAERVTGDPAAYRFAPRDRTTARIVERLAEAFARRRTTVIALIYRGEPSSAERFADAFRLRREDDEGDDL